VIALKKLDVDISVEPFEEVKMRNLEEKI